MGSFLSTEKRVYKQELVRDQSQWQLIMFGLLCMFPLAPTQVWALAQTESLGMAPLIYLIGAVAMLFTALSYKKMSSEFPIAGSSYSYIQRAVHPYIGFLAGWVIILDYSIIPGFLTKFATIWASEVVDWLHPAVIIVSFLTFVTIVSAFGGQVKTWINSVFLYGQWAFILGLFILGTKYVFIDGNGLGGFSLTPFYNPDTFSLKTVASAATYGLLGFIGFDSIATQSEEAKNATKAVGRAVVSSLIIIAFLFLTQAYMASLISPDYLLVNPDMGYFDVYRIVGGDLFYYAVITGCVLFVGIANVLPIMSAISRILYAMGRDNAIPFSGFFGKINTKTKTPLNGILFIYILSLFVAFLLSLEFLTRLVNFGAMSTYLMLNLTVPYYFLFKKGLKGVKNYLTCGLLPCIGAAIIVFIFTGFDGTTYLVGLSWLAIGIIVLCTRLKHFKENPPVIEEV